MTLGVSWKTRATRSLPTQPPMVDTGARACGSPSAGTPGDTGAAGAGATPERGAAAGAGGTGAPVRNVARTAFVRRVRATYIQAASSAKASSNAIVK